MIEDIVLKFSADKLVQLSDRIRDCLDRLTGEQVWTRKTNNENSIGNLVLHLCGNLQQWIGAGVAGKTDLRQRDGEFAARGGLQPPELKFLLNTTVTDTVETIRTLDQARLTEPLSIQKYNVTVTEAILHVVEHFAQHTGQIIFATKLITGQDLGYYQHLSNPQHSEKIP